MLVAAPRMLRNCIVLGGIEPLGTMGSVNLSAGYSDEAFNHRGIWFSLCEKGFFEPLTEAISRIEREKTAIAREEILPEKFMANYSRGEAIQWIYKNPLKVPMLMYFKVRSLWSNSLDKSVLLFSGLGFLSFMFVRPREAFSILFILGACTSAVGITWDVGDDRFLVPVEAPLFMLYALGLWSFIIASSELAVPRLVARWW
jgi:hypothetical protein